MGVGPYHKVSNPLSDLGSRVPQDSTRLNHKINQSDLQTQMKSNKLLYLVITSISISFS